MDRSCRAVPPFILLFAACALWGGATVLNKALLSDVSPISLLFIQLGASSLVLWCAVFTTGKRLPTVTALWVAVLLGLLNPGISYTFSFFGLQRISASVSSLLWACEPFMILVLAWFILRERISRQIAAIVLLSFAGVLLVTGFGLQTGAARIDQIGILLLLAAVFLCAIYTVFSRKISALNDPLIIVTLQQTAGVVWAGLLLAFYPGEGFAALAKIPGPVVANAALSGLLYYALAYWLYLIALRDVSAGVAGSFFNVIPLTAIIFGMVFLGETLSGIQWIGASAICVAALLLAASSESNKTGERAG